MAEDPGGFGNLQRSMSECPAPPEWQFNSLGEESSACSHARINRAAAAVRQIAASMATHQLTCFSSPADGICSGSVILQTGGDKGPKYLFNAPEGFARLVLEHKVRPSQNLRAAFVTQLSPHTMGGMAGVIMRLRQDGHDELQLHGPSGLCNNLHGLRHFVHWKHPRVFASEHSQFELPQVYEDGHVQVAALHQGSLTWPCPAWLLPAAPGTHSWPRTCAQTQLAQTEPTASTSGSSAAISSESDAEQLSGSSSSSSSHDGHIRRPDSGVGDSSSSASDCDSQGSSDSDSDSDSDRLDAEDNSGCCSEIPTSVLCNGSQQQTAFEQLDMLFSRKGAAGSMSTQLAALDLLKRTLGQSRHSVAQSAGGKTQHGLPCKGPARLPADKGSTRTCKGLPKQHPVAAEDGRTENSKAEWIQMQKGGNPVYSNQKAGRASSGLKPMASVGLWGYLVHLQASGQLLLLLDCPHVKALSAVRKHPVFHYLQSQPNRIAGVVHMTACTVTSHRSYTQWLKSLPGQQVLLNGGKQHVFQSAMRATARLNLLSPAVFPLPFGSKVLPCPVMHEESAQKKQKAELAQEVSVKGGAGATAAASMKEAAKHAQHAQQVLPTANAKASNAAVQMETQSSRHSKHAQHGQLEPESYDPNSTGHSGNSLCNSMPRCQDGSGTSGQDTVRAGSSKPRQDTPAAGKGRNPALVAGPVVNLVDGSTGLVTAPWDESEVECQSPEEVQRELLDSKPGVSDFIARLKASSPAFMQPAQLAHRNPMLIASVARSSAQHSPQPPLHPPVLGTVDQLPGHLPAVEMHQSSFSGNSTAHDMSHGPQGPNQYQAKTPISQMPCAHSQQMLLHQRLSPLPDSSMSSSGSRVGPGWNCPGAGWNRPGLGRDDVAALGPPPGFALVPIAPDGSLHYLGAITSPHQGGVGIAQGQQPQGPWHYPPPWTHNQKGPALSQPQLVDQYFNHQQQQWQLTQQPQQKVLVESAQHSRKRKHSDNGSLLEQGDANVGGGSGNSGGGWGSGSGGATMYPASNANAAAKLRSRLKAATAVTTAATAACSEPRAVPRQPLTGSSVAHHEQHGKPEPEGEELKTAKGVETVDPAEVQIPSKECRLQGPDAAKLTGHPDQDRYHGPHGPDCIKADDKTQVNFLGTGSAEPSKYRGGSAIHIRLGNGRGVLLDAGEGAWGALVRMYGYKAALHEVDSLAFVWISHKHADHMLGLPGILHARTAAQPSLLVIGPAEAARWLTDTAASQQLRYSFMHCSQLNRMSQQEQGSILACAGLASLRAVPVNHCHDAFGLVMLHTDGWKLVYSGDTRPCPALQEAGRACTLLIHEATFEAELIEHAKTKKHSTTEEALEVAAAMGAFRTILTHFSQRYSKVPVGLRSAGNASNTAMIAFDGMSVPFTLLPDLPKLAEGVELAFAEEDSGLDVDAMNADF